MNRLGLVAEEPAEGFAPPQPTQQQTNVALAGLVIALKALSQRTIVAIASLVDLVLIASAFVLWWAIIEGPTSFQITAASIYSLFMLVVVWLRSKRHA